MEEIVSIIVSIGPLVVAVGSILKNFFRNVFFTDTTIEYSMKTKAEKQRERANRTFFLFVVIWLLELMSYYILSPLIKVIVPSERGFSIIVSSSVILFFIVFLVLIYRDAKFRKSQMKNKKINDILGIIMLFLNVTVSISYDNTTILNSLFLQASVAYLSTFAMAYFLFPFQNIDKALIYFEDSGKQKFIYHGFRNDYCIVGEAEIMGEGAILYPIDSIKGKRLYTCMKDVSNADDGSDRQLSDSIDSLKKEISKIENILEDINKYKEDLE